MLNPMCSLRGRGSFCHVSKTIRDPQLYKAGTDQAVNAYKRNSSKAQ